MHLDSKCQQIMLLQFLLLLREEGEGGAWTADAELQMLSVLSQFGLTCFLKAGEAI